MFDLRLAGPDGSQAFRLADASPAFDSGFLAPGVSYEITESASDDWDLTGLACFSRTGEITYTAMAPDYRFTPLGMPDRELSLAEILDTHPKGRGGNGGGL